MIFYLKKLFSRQYKHNFEHMNGKQFPTDGSYFYDYYKCKKCGWYKDLLWPEVYLGLSLCKLSDNEYIIKSIIE